MDPYGSTWFPGGSWGLHVSPTSMTVGLFLDTADLPEVIHSAVTSRLVYCNAVHMGLSLETVLKLQQVLNAAVKWRTGAGYRERITQQLHWMLISFQALFKVLV